MSYDPVKAHAYYLAHREEYRARDVAYRAAYPDRKSASSARWYAGLGCIEIYVVYAGSTVIYVGRTNNWDHRLKHHEFSCTPWLNEMTDVHHRYHATYGDSFVDEALLIRLYQPKYNREGVTR